VYFPAREASLHGRFWNRFLSALVVIVTLSGQAPGGAAMSPSAGGDGAGQRSREAAPGAAAGSHQAEAGPPEPTHAEQGFPLTVRVSQLRNARGRVAVALFASPSDFPDQKRALAGQLAKIDKGRAAVTFTGLKPGLYAVAVLHDENDNEKMDFNFLGMPLEGYGFSNDASAPFGPPSFEAAAFKLTPRPSYIPVKVRYFF
jgi:uncharacterized protein (DUF2141 family)